MLDAYSPVHYKAFAFILFHTLAEYDKCSPLLETLLLTLARNIVAQKEEAATKMLLVLGVRNPQSIACDVRSLRFQDKA
jgi:hypothetical protein